MNGLSRMRGDPHVRFLGGGGAVRRCCYPTAWYDPRKQGKSALLALNGLNAGSARRSVRRLGLSRCSTRRDGQLALAPRRHNSLKPGSIGQKLTSIATESPPRTVRSQVDVG
jgi:hypothetical protein